MSGSGAPPTVRLIGDGLRIAVLAAKWHQSVMDGLVAGADRALNDAGVRGYDVIRVPGAFELPVAAATIADNYDAIVALGVVIRGGTPHFDYVCAAATDGLLKVAVEHRTPIGFGLLTCDTEQQALDRAGLVGRPGMPDSAEDKGYEAASAALETVLALRRVRSASDPDREGRRDRARTSSRSPSPG
ncbi:MAG: 6,7-dimethyl-8-ribityllumazine synthase [Nocardioides sp.]